VGDTINDRRRSLMPNEAAIIDAFQGARDRIERANSHRAELSNLWNTFLEDEPFSFGLHVDDEGKAELWVDVHSDPPRECGVVIGEWLYNLRTALDYAIYGLAIADSGQFPPPSADKIQFPVCVTAEQFRRQQYRLSDLSDEHRTRLDEVQPYRSPAGPEAHPLFWLNELARLDRHRSISVVGAAIATSDPIVYAPNAETVTFDDVKAGVYLEEGSVLATFTVSPYSPGDEVSANPQTGIDLEIRGFPGTGPLRELEINDRLRLITANVKVIIDAIDEAATGRPQRPVEDAASGRRLRQPVR
jgi:hypothetical protein